ncbi:MAG: TlpA family protein disulfide reductase [Thermomicrobiales bacterium]
MDVDGSQNSEPGASLAERIVHALPALLIAINLVLVSVIIDRPWQHEPQGLAPQVAPERNDLRELETGSSIGSLAPNFLLQDPTGAWTELATLRGTPVLINFWTTSCVYCVSEMPAIQRIADRYQDDVSIVGINVGESDTRVSDFAASLDVRYLLLLDQSLDVTQAYRVPGLPTTVFIDPFGVVRAIHSGPLQPDQMIEQLELLLANESIAQGFVSEL